MNSNLPNRCKGVHYIIHSVEAIIDLKYQTTNIYDTKYFSANKENCSYVGMY